MKSKKQRPRPTFHRQVELGKLTASIYLHDDGTHSLGFLRYGHGEGDRYFQMSFHLTGNDIDVLIGELQHIRAEARRREETTKADATGVL